VGGEVFQVPRRQPVSPAAERAGLGWVLLSHPTRERVENLRLIRIERLRPPEVLLVRFLPVP
jgi:hypothetical protein